LSVEEIARKDVPRGVRYAIIDEADVPTDHTFFTAWEVEHSDLNDGIGAGPQTWFIEKFQAELALINAETPPSKTEEEADEAYAAAVAHWEAGKAMRIEHLNKMIAAQQAELEALG
jgi:hypothetical protein